MDNLHVHGNVSILLTSLFDALCNPGVSVSEDPAANLCEEKRLALAFAIGYDSGYKEGRLVGGFENHGG